MQLDVRSQTMPTRYTVVCDDDLARDVEELAREYDLTEEEVLRQLVDVGLGELESEAA
jgi:predicted transcriptional regulator